MRISWIPANTVYSPRMSSQSQNEVSGNSVPYVNLEITLKTIIEPFQQDEAGNGNSEVKD